VLREMRHEDKKSVKPKSHGSREIYAGEVEDMFVQEGTSLHNNAVNSFE